MNRTDDSTATPTESPTGGTSSGPTTCKNAPGPGATSTQGTPEDAPTDQRVNPELTRPGFWDPGLSDRIDAATAIAAPLVIADKVRRRAQFRAHVLDTIARAKAAAERRQAQAAGEPPTAPPTPERTWAASGSTLHGSEGRDPERAPEAGDETPTPVDRAKAGLDAVARWAPFMAAIVGPYVAGLAMGYGERLAEREAKFEAIDPTACGKAWLEGSEEDHEQRERFNGWIRWFVGRRLEVYDDEKFTANRYARRWRLAHDLAERLQWPEAFAVSTKRLSLAGFVPAIDLLNRVLGDLEEYDHEYDGEDETFADDELFDRVELIEAEATKTCARLDHITNRLDSQDSWINDTRRKVTEVGNRADSQDTINREVAKAIDRLAERITELERAEPGDQRELERRLEQAQARTEVAEARVANAEAMASERAELGRRMDAQTDRLAKLEANVADWLVNDLRQTDDRLGTLANRVQEIEDNVALAADLAKITDRILELGARVESLLAGEALVGLANAEGAAARAAINAATVEEGWWSGPTAFDMQVKHSTPALARACARAKGWEFIAKGRRIRISLEHMIDLDELLDNADSWADEFLDDDGREAARKVYELGVEDREELAREIQAAIKRYELRREPVFAWILENTIAVGEPCLDATNTGDEENP